MGVITISLGVRLNDAGLEDFCQGLKNFKKNSGVSSNFSGGARKNGQGFGGCVTGGV